MKKSWVGFVQVVIQYKFIKHSEEFWRVIAMDQKRLKRGVDIKLVSM